MYTLTFTYSYSTNIATPDPDIIIQIDVFFLILIPLFVQMYDFCLSAPKKKKHNLSASFLSFTFMHFLSDISRKPEHMLKKIPPQLHFE